jgi:hypothetical protein
MPEASSPGMGRRDWQRGVGKRRGESTWALQEFRSGRCWSVRTDPPKPSEKKMSCPGTVRPGPLTRYDRLHCSGSLVSVPIRLVSRGEAASTQHSRASD